jgi:uncharacterized DUF497 family protein
MDIHERLLQSTGFEWDQGNADKNWLTHGVSTGECEQIFFNEPFVVSEDTAHSQKEARFYALGRADTGRRLFVVFTLRHHQIRVISARDMSQKEGRSYDHFEENT